MSEGNGVKVAVSRFLCRLCRNGFDAFLHSREGGRLCPHCGGVDPTQGWMREQVRGLPVYVVRRES